MIGELLTECCGAYETTADNVLVCRRCGKENPFMVTDYERTTTAMEKLSELLNNEIGET